MQMALALQTVEGIGVQGPAPALISRVRNQYIQEVWVKCPRDAKLLDHVKAYIKDQRLQITFHSAVTRVCRSYLM